MEHYILSNKKHNAKVIYCFWFPEFSNQQHATSIPNKKTWINLPQFSQPAKHAEVGIMIWTFLNKINSKLIFSKAQYINSSSTLGT